MSVYGVHTHTDTHTHTHTHWRVQQWRNEQVVSEAEENWWAMMLKLVDLPLRAMCTMLKKWNEKSRRTSEQWLRDVADSTNISRTSVHKILQQNFEMKKVCSKLVLKVLMLEQKKEQVFVAEAFLNDCEADPKLFVRIVTGVESLVFEYDPFTKCQSVQWKRSDETWHKKTCMARSQQKLI